MTADKRSEDVDPRLIDLIFEELRNKRGAPMGWDPDRWKAVKLARAVWEWFGEGDET